MEETHPKVFISYSQDSEDYKDFVRAFADRLIEEGVEVTLDQYDLKLGDMNPHFMEKGITNSDFVLIFITSEYVKKADERLHGAGYETNIITGEISINDNSRKFIPVFIKTDFDNAPAYLKGKNAVRISNLFNYDNEYEAIYKAVTSQTLKKPELGKIRKIFTVSNQNSFDIQKLCSLKNVDQWVSFDCIFELNSLNNCTLGEIYSEFLKHRIIWKNNSISLKEILLPLVLSDDDKKSHGEVILYESGDYSRCSNQSIYDKIQFEENLIKYSYIELTEHRSHQSSLLKGKIIIENILLILKLIEDTIAAFSNTIDINISFRIDNKNDVDFYVPDRQLFMQDPFSNYHLSNNKKGRLDFKDFSATSKIRLINRFLELFISEDQTDKQPYIRIKENYFNDFQSRLLSGCFEID